LHLPYTSPSPRPEFENEYCFNPIINVPLHFFQRKLPAKQLVSSWRLIKLGACGEGGLKRSRPEPCGIVHLQIPKHIHHEERQPIRFLADHIRIPVDWHAPLKRYVRYEWTIKEWLQMPACKLE
jgi:hypothetical protein